MEQQHYIRLLWQSAWLIAVCIVLGGIAAWAATRQMQPVYAATTTFAVTLQSPDVLNDDRARLMGTYTQLLLTRPVLEAVIADLDLQTTVDDLQKQVRVASGSSSMLIQVTVEDTGPRRAALTANALVAALIDEGRLLLQDDQIARRSSVRMVEAAQPDRDPVRPRTLLIVVLGAMFGAAASSGGILAYSYFRDLKVHSSNQVEAVFGVSTVATIPRNRFAFARGPLVIREQAHSSLVESYHTLHARMATMLPASVRTIAVMSARAAEGKSTVAANLGVVLAQAGKQVIIVDANLRSPTLHTFFEVGNVQGLAGVLEQASHSVLNTSLLPTSVERLRLLPAGMANGMPTDLLSSPHMVWLCAELALQADIVLFDTPALMNAADAMLVAKACDVALLVVQAESTTIDAAHTTQKHLEGFGIQPWGVVLNGAHPQTAGFLTHTQPWRKSSPPHHHHHHIEQTASMHVPYIMAQHSSRAYDVSRGEPPQRNNENRAS